ncbi:MAG: AbrB/MazE/SpoVT family DNA-binding domain-containing protein [Chloroflexi bacterium]|nr:AbrB/MazE/SpoVT family DNA-binding domain-containing protein [Chloroflexota bacterium]
MERVRQIVGPGGLQIPLLVMERYGLQPGTGVVLELEKDGIRILPALLSQEEIENRALHYLLTGLGDATTVRAERRNGEWYVFAYGASIAEPLGRLAYSPSGEILLEQSTPIEEMRQRAEQSARLP